MLRNKVLNLARPNIRTTVIHRAECRVVDGLTTERQRHRNGTCSRAATAGNRGGGIGSNVLGTDSETDADDDHRGDDPLEQQESFSDLYQTEA